MKKLLFVFLFFHLHVFGQGINNLWLLGYQTNLDGNSTSRRGTIDFNQATIFADTSNRKMKFDATEGNISDSNGSLLMSSDGIWISNMTGDTMLNGSNLNPNTFTDNFKTDGLPLTNGNVFIPWPGDSTKYILFHMTGNLNSPSALSATELYYSIIDMTMDNGLGAVSQKNQVAFQATLSWGIGACKHANGRDWWVVALEDNSNTIYKLLITPSGVSSVITQTFPTQIINFGTACQPVFSPDGNKFAFTTGTAGNTRISYFDFDRCTGVFSNYQSLSAADGNLSLATAFSSNSKYLYAATNGHIYQVNTDSTVMIVDTVATYDGYSFPPGFNTDFWLMYLATNNKIYLTSGSSVLDLHCIESPDSGGIACNVQQHSLHLPCYNFRTVPNHPNYFLGADSTSICDSITYISFVTQSLSTISVSPNPASAFITINAQQIKDKVVLLFVYDNLGNEIDHMKTKSNNGFVTQDVYVGNLNSGMYIVKLQTEYGVYTTKFIKQ